jgi:hypothetical protein
MADHGYRVTQGETLVVSFKPMDLFRSLRRIVNHQRALIHNFMPNSLPAVDDAQRPRGYSVLSPHQ